jgi:hypothetical protein
MSCKHKASQYLLLDLLRPVVIGQPTTTSTASQPFLVTSSPGRRVYDVLSEEIRTCFAFSCSRCISKRRGWGGRSERCYREFTEIGVKSAIGDQPKLLGSHRCISQSRHEWTSVRHSPCFRRFTAIWTVFPDTNPPRAPTTLGWKEATPNNRAIHQQRSTGGRPPP